MKKTAVVSVLRQRPGRAGCNAQELRWVGDGLSSMDRDQDVHQGCVVLSQAAMVNGLASQQEEEKPSSWDLVPRDL